MDATHILRRAEHSLWVSGMRVGLQRKGRQYDSFLLRRARPSKAEPLSLASDSSHTSRLLPSSIARGANLCFFEGVVAYNAFMTNL